MSDRNLTTRIIKQSWQTVKAPPPWVRRTIFWTMLLLGVGAFAYVIHMLDVDKTIQALRAVGWEGVAAYVATATAVLIFPAVGWWILMKAEGTSTNPLLLCKANLMAWPVDIIAPSMYLGGIPVKMFYVASRYGIPYRRVLGSVIVNRFQELATLILLIVAAAAYFLWTSPVLTTQSEILIGTITIVCISMVVFFLYAVLTRMHPSVWILKQLGRFKFMKPRLEDLKAKAVEVEDQIYESLVHRWRSFLLSLFVTFLSAVSIFIRPIIFDRFTGNPNPIGLQTICIIYIITNVVHFVQIIPGSIGVFEAVSFAYFSNVGTNWTQETLGAYLVVNRLADLLLFVFGFVLLFHYGLVALARGKRKVELEPAAPPPPPAEPPANLPAATQEPTPPA